MIYKRSTGNVRIALWKAPAQGPLGKRKTIRSYFLVSNFADCSQLVLWNSMVFPTTSCRTSILSRSLSSYLFVIVCSTRFSERLAFPSDPSLASPWDSCLLHFQWHTLQLSNILFTKRPLVTTLLWFALLRTARVSLSSFTQPASEVH